MAASRGARERTLDRVYINDAVAKMKDRDKDIRWMICDDLLTVVADHEPGSLTMTKELEEKLMGGLRALYSDRAAEVAQKAALLSASLVPHLLPSSVSTLLQSIGDIVAKEAEADKREIAVLGLREIPENLPDEGVMTLLEVVLPQASAAIDGKSPTDPKGFAWICDAVGVTTVVLTRYGGQVSEEQLERLQVSLTGCCTRLPSRYEARRPVLECLATLAACVSRSQFDVLVRRHIESLADPSSDGFRYSLQIVSLICRTAGHRLGRFVPELVPRFLKALATRGADMDTDLREFCLQGLAEVVRARAGNVDAHMEEIIASGSEFAAFDPNYTGMSLSMSGDAVEGGEE
eukprot:CAMPEP_0119153768 /NCGR_PEP_ID=MMETSP1310-20130426/49764_1 /TAXON_ID=464262 /ORGANISM="Genus nov. species nov., Strain RCC2339" /LENGTH=347 /DNA_ID=CAMNT_0007146243 /DNA_START=45 /DNA_END=1085 /DNA_ORIENTATION=+